MRIKEKSFTVWDDAFKTGYTKGFSEGVDLGIAYSISVLLKDGFHYEQICRLFPSEAISNEDLKNIENKIKENNSGT